MSDAVMDKVNRSYGQCCTSKGFFDDFYNNFLASSPEIAGMFAGTEMTRQKQLLRAGIGHLIMAYRGQPMSKMKLEKIAVSHNAAHMNIKPALYPLWKKALLTTIAKHDPEFDEEIRKAWLKVLDKGISDIIARY